MTPFYDDGQVTIWCADVRDVPASELAESAACVVTSPPYNVGLGYDGDDQGDTLAWDEYWRLADAAAVVMARALVPGGPGVGQHRGVGPRDATAAGPHSGRAGSGGCCWPGAGPTPWSSVGAWCWWTRCRGPRCGPVGVRGGRGSPRRRRTCAATTS